MKSASLRPLMLLLLGLATLQLNAQSADNLASFERSTTQLATVSGEKLCMFILEDGRFRMERGSWLQSDARKTKVYQSAVSQTSLEALKNLLNDKQLLTFHSPEYDKFQVGFTGDVVMFSFRIPRADEIKHAHFTNPDGKTPFPKSVQSVERWFRDAVKTKAQQDRQATPNNCTKYD